MSLEYGSGWAETGDMTFSPRFSPSFSPGSPATLDLTGRRTSAPTNPAGRTGFSPQHLRQVMGPGYQIALFREGPTLTGTDGGLTVGRPASTRRRSASRPPRPPWTGLRLAATARSLQLGLARVVQTGRSSKPLAPQAI